MYILVTNNPLTLSLSSSIVTTQYCDMSFMDVLLRVRDFIHMGHTLLTHPLSGSVKPNETLYKSVLISEKVSDVDESSVIIIGEAILKTQSFAPRVIPEKYKKDLQEVDLSLIRSVVNF